MAAGRGDPDFPIYTIGNGGHFQRCFHLIVNIWQGDNATRVVNYARISATDYAGFVWKK